MTATGSFFGLRKHLSLYPVIKMTMILFYKALIRTVITYALETSSLLRSVEKLLTIFERIILRTILGL